MDITIQRAGAVDWEPLPEDGIVGEDVVRIRFGDQEIRRLENGMFQPVIPEPPRLSFDPTAALLTKAFGKDYIPRNRHERRRERKLCR